MVLILIEIMMHIGKKFKMMLDKLHQDQIHFQNQKLEQLEIHLKHLILIYF